MKYISFEGPDGFGKSTTMKDCKKSLRILNPKYIKEPGGTAQGLRIRRLITNTKSENMDPVTMSYLMAGARSDVIRKKVVPALKESKLVISDRCILSSYAYQGIQIANQYLSYQPDQLKQSSTKIRQHLTKKLITNHALNIVHDINNKATFNNQIIPSMVFLFLSKDLHSIQKRLAGRTEKSDWIDKKLEHGSEILNNLQNAYYKAAKYWKSVYPNSKIIIINANKSRAQRKQIVMDNLINLN